MVGALHLPGGVTPGNAYSIASANSIINAIIDSVIIDINAIINSTAITINNSNSTIITTKNNTITPPPGPSGQVAQGPWARRAQVGPTGPKGQV